MLRFQRSIGFQCATLRITCYYAFLENVTVQRGFFLAKITRNLVLVLIWLYQRTEIKRIITRVRFREILVSLIVQVPRTDVVVSINLAIWYDKLHHIIWSKNVKDICNFYVKYYCKNLLVPCWHGKYYERQCRVWIWILCIHAVIIMDCLIIRRLVF